MCDIDHFKQVNDVYGHMYGDLVLRKVSQTLLHGSRASDVVARYGGDEFVVLLCEAGAEQARVAAERLRAAVKSLSFAHPSGSFGVTMSVGVTTSVVGKSVDPAVLLAEADEALYAAKGRGRDCVACYERG